MWGHTLLSETRKLTRYECVSLQIGMPFEPQRLLAAWKTETAVGIVFYRMRGYLRLGGQVEFEQLGDGRCGRDKHNGVGTVSGRLLDHMRLDALSVFQQHTAQQWFLDGVRDVVKVRG